MPATTMENLIIAGYKARKSGNVEQEISLFREFCQRERLPNDDTYLAEIKWEAKLSELKWKNQAALQGAVQYFS